MGLPELVGKQDILYRKDWVLINVMERLGLIYDN
jgi:hypothetical protein